VDQHHVDADPELISDPTPDFTLVGKSKKKYFLFPLYSLAKEVEVPF
jgi:hypothetical protein